MENIQGNVSTIAVALYAVLAPYIGQYVSQDVFIAILGLLIVIWSAYNPNTMAIFGNNNNTDALVDELDDSTGDDEE